MRDGVIRRLQPYGAFVDIGGLDGLVHVSEISVEERSDRVALMPGAASLSEIVDALNLLGVGAADLVVILESLKQAGALKAEMVVL